MKRLFILLFAFSLPAAAQTADVRIGVINMGKILRDSQLVGKVEKKLEREFSPREQEIQKMRKQAKDLQAFMEKESPTMPEVERTKKQKELASLVRDVQHAERTFREDASQRKNEELAEINKRLQKVIGDIAEKEKYDLILEHALYASPRADITERVLKALDR